MNDFKTVEANSYDLINTIKHEDVERMKTSLSACSVENPIGTKVALQQITLLRIHHQVARIIKYLDLMDKLEDKLYRCIDDQIDMTNTDDTAGLMALLKIQSKLQYSMIESHKLLQPYLNLESFDISELIPSTATDADSKTMLIPSESREKIRNSAQAVLLALDSAAS